MRIKLHFQYPTRKCGKVSSDIINFLKEVRKKDFQSEGHFHNHMAHVPENMLFLLLGLSVCPCTFSGSWRVFVAITTGCGVLD